MAKITNHSEKQIIKLDLKDRKLLFELDKNSRMSISEISKRIGLNKQTTKNRLDKLKKLGVIKDFLTIINTEKLGYYFYNIYLQLEGMNKKEENEFLKFAKNYSATDWIVSGHGRWNYIISVLAKDNKDFNKSLIEILNKAGSYLRDHALFIVTGANQMPYRYIFADTKLKYKKPVVFSSEQDYDYKKIDLKILKKLSENARLNNSDLGRLFNITRNKVKYKIDKMEKCGLIQAYRPLLNVDKLGYDWFIVFLNLKNITQDEELVFVNTLRGISYVNYIVKGIGKWNLILEIHTRDIEHFNDLMNHIVDKFPNVIKSYEYTHVLKEHKCNFFPMGVLS